MASNDQLRLEYVCRHKLSNLRGVGLTFCFVWTFFGNLPYILDLVIQTSQDIYFMYVGFFSLHALLVEVCGHRLSDRVNFYEGAQIITGE